jgi:hypothetical protein
MAKKTNKKSLNTFVIKDLDSDQKNEHYGIFEHLIVGISISDSEELSQLGFSKIHIQDAMIEFARYLLVHGATLAYGGDLRSDGYTLLFSELAFQYRSRQDQDKQHFINFSSFPIYLNISPKHKFEFIKNRVDFRPIKPPENLKISTKTFIPPIGNENKFIWAESLSKMRNEMNEATNARIFMGGKCRGYSGKYPGILEEAILALETDIPTYFIGAFGGASKSIIDLLLNRSSKEFTEDWQFENKNYKDFYEYYNKQTKNIKINYTEISSFIKNYSLKRMCENNGLNEKDNLRLFETTHIPEMIFLVLKGLSNKKANA